MSNQAMQTTTQTLSSKRYTVDAECNAEYFWSRIRRAAQHCPIPRFGDWLAVAPDSSSIELDADEAAVVDSWLAEQPGWTDPDYAVFAPHPLVAE